MNWADPSGDDGPTPAATIEVPRIPVVVSSLVPEAVEIATTYSGMVKPLERYSVGFETAGRVASLGVSESGQPLDVGARVSAGQVLARLDDRVAAAQLREARANLEKAQSDRHRADEARVENPRVVTESDYQQLITAIELAQARLTMAEKNLEDNSLLAPASGVISKRWIKPGESVSAHQAVFEVLEVDRVLLTVGVPESRVREVCRGQKAEVSFLGKNAYGEPWPAVEGEVYRVAESADGSTGLFDVELAVPNPTGELKPGLIASGRIVTSVVQGFRIPETSVLFDKGREWVFSVHVSAEGKHVAHRVELGRHIEQGRYFVVSGLPEEDRTIVVRGQHRLVEGNVIEIVTLEGEEGADVRPEISVRGTGGSQT